MNENGHMTRLDPREVEKHLRAQARRLRECYSARCASDYDEAADCIRNLRFTHAPRVLMLHTRDELNKAISLIRNERSIRALNTLQLLLSKLDDTLWGPTEEDDV